MTKNPLTFKHIQNGVPLPAARRSAGDRRATTPRSTTRRGLGHDALGVLRGAARRPAGCTFAQAQRADARLPGRRLQADAATRRRSSRRATRCSPPRRRTIRPTSPLLGGLRQARRRRRRGGARPLRHRRTTAWSRASSSAPTWRSRTPRWARRRCPATATRYLDEGELAELSVTVRNTGATALTSTAADGHVHGSGRHCSRVATRSRSPATAAFTSATVTVPVRLDAGAATPWPSRSRSNDPAPRRARAAGPAVPRVRAGRRGAQRDVESFDTVTDVWTYTGDTGPLLGWERVEFGARATSDCSAPIPARSRTRRP